MKNKRGSVSGMFSSARKESSLLLAPQLVLKQCVSQAPPGAGKTTTKIIEHVLQLPGSATSKGSSAGARETPHLSASTVVNLFGGPVLNINTLNAKEAEAVLSAAALAKRQADAHAAAAAAGDGKPRGPAGPPVPAADTEDDGSRMIDDVEATTRELRAAQPPAASKQISTFYTLVSAKWLKAKLVQEAAAAANALAAKDKTQKKTKKASSAATDGTANEVEETAHSGNDNAALQLIAVGPAMQSAEIVRWDFQHDLCAVVLAGSSAINILRLSVLSGEESSMFPQLDLHTLQSVDFCVPRSLRVSPLCGLTWANGVLFATEESSASINAVYCSHVSGAKVPASYPAIYSANVFELPNFSPVRGRTRFITYLFLSLLVFYSTHFLFAVFEWLPCCLASQYIQRRAGVQSRACERSAGTAATHRVHRIEVGRISILFALSRFLFSLFLSPSNFFNLLQSGTELCLEFHCRSVRRSWQRPSRLAESVVYLAPLIQLICRCTHLHIHSTGLKRFPNSAV